MHDENDDDITTNTVLMMTMTTLTVTTTTTTILTMRMMTTTIKTRQCKLAQALMLITQHLLRAFRFPAIGRRRGGPQPVASDVVALAVVA